MFCFSDDDIYMLSVLHLKLFQKILGVLLLVEFDCLILFSCIWCKKCGDSFGSVYMKIISGGPFIDFVKVWLNE